MTARGWRGERPKRRGRCSRGQRGWVPSSARSGHKAGGSKSSGGAAGVRGRRRGRSSPGWPLSDGGRRYTRDNDRCRAPGVVPTSSAPDESVHALLRAFIPTGAVPAAPTVELALGGVRLAAGLGLLCHDGEQLMRASLMQSSNGDLDVVCASPPLQRR
uniref:Uncharacterized protein n=1 Tax=Setaria viridis TaxID=4556 RepID=A0A4V6D9F1_SETVI|nr:hypothetical protein SEVIR_3G131600v2 [Setaria viridis]